MIKFHPSSVGNLLVGSEGITDRQRQRLDELEQRIADPTAKPLTEKMKSELTDLRAKQDAPFEFGSVAKSYIRDVWLERNFGYKDLVVSNEQTKGILCEDEALGMLSRHIPAGGFRVKNETEYENDWFVGTPDVVGDWIEDVKCNWTVKQFQAVHRPDPMYVAQGQAYMDLTGITKFRLVYCLLDTPVEIVDEERKKYYFKFGGDEDNQDLQGIYRILEAVHTPSKQIPEEKRIKVFELYRDEEYLTTLKRRIEQARNYYSAITL